MKKLVMLSVLFTLSLISVVPIVLSLGIKLIPDRVQPPTEQSEAIYQDKVVIQSFIAREDNLTGIGVSIRNWVLQNKKDIHLELYDKDNKLLRRSTLSGKNIQDGSFMKFQFEPLADSKDKKYTFVFKAPDALESDSLRILYTSKSVEGATDFMARGEQREGAVSFVAFHKPNNPLSLTLGIYLNLFNRLIADTLFFVFYTITIISLVSGILFLQFKRVK